MRVSLSIYIYLLINIKIFLNKYIYIIYIIYIYIMIPSLPPDQIVDQVDVIVVFHHQILTEHENMGHQGNLASTFIPK